MKGGLTASVPCGICLVTLDFAKGGPLSLGTRDGAVIQTPWTYLCRYTLDNSWGRTARWHILVNLKKTRCRKNFRFCFVLFFLNSQTGILRDYQVGRRVSSQADDFTGSSLYPTLLGSSSISNRNDGWCLFTISRWAKIFSDSVRLWGNTLMSAAQDRVYFTKSPPNLKI